MTPDIDIQYYYNAFILKAKGEIRDCENRINEVNKAIANVKGYLDSNKSKLKDWTGINLDEYREYNDLVYVKGEPLANRALKKLEYFPDSSQERIMIFQVLRLAKLLLKKNKVDKQLAIANKKISLNKIQYQNYLERYYGYSLSKCLLNGYAYKFGYGIGELMVSRWRYHNKSTNNKIIDFHATAKIKAELEAKGIEVYNRNLAKAKKEAGEEYNAIDCLVYKDRPYYYEIHIYNPKIVAHRHLLVEFSQRIDRRFYGRHEKGTYKKHSYQDIADKLTSMEDVYNLKFGLFAKVAIANLYDKTLFMNFIRNPSQEKWSRGTHVTKHRRKY